MSVESHVQEIRERGEAVIDAIPKRVTDILNSTASGQRKYTMLVQVADDAATVIAPSTPCRRGCAHCCYQAVGISEREAKMIGEHVGRQPVSLPKISMSGISDLIDRNIERFTRTRCPFLSTNNVCTIYEVRPMACRTNHNLADTPDNCNLFKGAQPVPMINLMPLMHGIAWLDLSRAFADIRQFFP